MELMKEKLLTGFEAVGQSGIHIQTTQTTYLTRP